MKYTVSPYGKFYYFDNDVIGRTIAEGKFWEDFYKPWFDKLKTGDVFVDVGANIGFFTIYAGLKDVWVWSFEASREVYKLLAANVGTNKVDANVRLENVALYDSQCALVMNSDWLKSVRPDLDYEKMENSGGLSLVRGSGSSCYWSRTLDSYRLPQLDLLKVDAQGSDVRILVGGRETIKKHRPVVLFEMEPVPARLHGDSEETAMEFFRELDYDVQCVRVGVDAYGEKDFVAVPRG